MKPVLCLAVALAVSIGPGQPTLAQSMTIDLAVEPVGEPIPIAYRELPPTPVAAETGLAFFKDGTRVSGTEQRYAGTVSFRKTGDELEGAADLTSADNPAPVHSVCRMHASGALIGCTPAGTMQYPILARPAYKSGDRISLPFSDIGGEPWLIEGHVKGKAVVGNRPALVIDFAETRAIERTLSDGTLMTLRLSIAGYGYLDLATGHPIVLELTMEGTSPGGEYDRIEAHLRMELALSGAP